MPTGAEGKVVAITGASSGIGEATARVLTGAGAKVALGARRMDRLQSLANDLGESALAHELDVADEGQANGFLTAARDHFGRVDVLVNNAGVMLLGPVQDADTEDWRRMVDVNVLGLLYCTHAALPIMRDQGGGHIVNISSVAGRHAALGAAVYNFTKFGVCGFSEALRQEALHIGVRVTIVEPGFVATELQGHNTNPVVVQATEQMREQIGEILSAEDIAQAILYAISQPAHVSVNELLIRPTRQRR